MKIAVVGDVHIKDTVNRSRLDDYLETCLNKLIYLLDRYDYVIILGDLFNKPVVPIETLNTIFYRLNKYKGKLISIIGNHDAYYRTSNLNKTALGLLNNMGIVDVKTDTFSIGEHSFDVVSVVPELEKPKHESKYLIGHCYFEKQGAEKESLFAEDLEGYSHVFLGHEHTPLGISEIGDTLLIRHGSLLRNDSSEYNLIRDCIYYSVIDEDGIHTESMSIVPSSEVFTPESIDKPRKLDNKYSLANLNEFISNFGKKIDEDEMSTERILIDTLETPQPCIEYLRCVHESLGLYF